uniref:Sesamin methylene transferase n=1 Tax=Sinomonas sp. (strain No.22) TaxID=1762963 RepID=SESA_SINX2|nr:RecName: Full=Sesamin methylene transferase; AltName: Full=Sesamin-metabolizing enzyme; AltName: Full=THF-dependent sesamin/sesamin-monocatechol methylenetransferase [Sinomonas sp. No.22]BAW03116.1 sesamin methylene transferase [Sinomonas sp. No.22]
MTAEQAINEGAFSLAASFGFVPLEYRGYEAEVLASKETAYIGTALNGAMSPIYDVTGPDALEFLRSVCINSFRGFQVGQIRHAVLCNDKGQILTDGVVARIDEDTYRTYWLAPALEYRLINSGLDVKGEDQSSNEFFFQLAGPRSLEVLEAAAHEDLHDIAFGRHRMSTIAGIPVRILRLGMAGGLAYEVHGAAADTETAYRAIWEAGQPFGLVKQGLNAYLMQHTEAGFPNINLHYPLPWYEDPDMAAFFDTRPTQNFYNKYRFFYGSVGPDAEARFVTPYQIGLGKMVDFNHDFIGKEALQREAEADHWAAVTLVWNEDDVADVVASKYRGRDVEPYDKIDDRPFDIYHNLGQPGFAYHADWVLADGERIGTSTGRINSVYYRRMISLGFIDKRHAAEGTELTVLWGRPGTPQKEIRVTVGRYPYFDLEKNNAIDVASIPRPALDVSAGA